MNKVLIRVVVTQTFGISRIRIPISRKPEFFREIIPENSGRLSRKSSDDQIPLPAETLRRRDPRKNWEHLEQHCDRQIHDSTRLSNGSRTISSQPQEPEKLMANHVRTAAKKFFFGSCQANRWLIMLGQLPKKNFLAAVRILGGLTGEAPQAAS